MHAKYRYFQWVLILLFVVVTNSFAGIWEEISELPTSRIGMATATVNGNIYLFGGFDPRENLGGGAPALTTVDVYDTLTNTWHKTADIPTPRISAQAAVFASEIYVFGGFNQTAIRGEKSKKVVEVYDTRTDTWAKKRDMPTLRKSFGTAVVDGKIYIIGGSVHDKQLGKQVTTDLVEVYDPLTNRWEKRANMPTKRERMGTAVVGGKVYVIGGHVLLQGVGIADRFITTIEAYNPKIDRWRKLPDMPKFRFTFATTVVDNEIYIIGGYSLENGFKRITAVDVYNPMVNRWRIIEPIPTAKTTVAAVAKGTIYLFGGLVGNNRFSPIVEAFDTGFLAVNPKDKLPTSWGKLKKSD